MSVSVKAQTVMYKGDPCFIAIGDYEKGPKKISLRNGNTGEHVEYLTTYIDNLLPGEVAIKAGYLVLLQAKVIDSVHRVETNGDILFICNLK